MGRGGRSGRGGLSTPPATGQMTERLRGACVSGKSGLCPPYSSLVHTACLSGRTGDAMPQPHMQVLLYVIPRCVRRIRAA